MNKFRFLEMAEEFPFLRELGATPECDSIQVKRWDEAVLGLMPTAYDYDGSLVNDWRKDEWHLVAGDGIIRDFVKPEYRYHSQYAHSQDRTETGETVLEGLMSKNGTADPRFLVRHVVEHEDTSGRAYRHTDHWTVYKPARDVCVAELMCRAFEKARREIRAELDF